MEARGDGDGKGEGKDERSTMGIVRGSKDIFM